MRTIKLAQYLKNPADPAIVALKTAHESITSHDHDFYERKALLRLPRNFCDVILLHFVSSFLDKASQPVNLWRSPCRTPP